MNSLNPMNQSIKKLYDDYLMHTEDKAAAASLVMADVMLGGKVREEPDSLTVKDVARRLGVSSRVAYELCQDGEIDAFKIGRTIRVKPTELEAYVERRTNRLHPR
jgi:excisionase family DNA binding protein